MSSKSSSASSETKTGGEMSLSKTAEMLQNMAKPLMGFVTWFLPIFIASVQKATAFYKKLPVQATKFLIGFIFCFFGGLYPTLFAAIQAAEHGGRKTVATACSDIAEEAMMIIQESKKDDKKDDDNDGVEDVKQIDSKTYALRKANLVLTKMNPEKVDKAIASIYRVWLSVVAVLTIQFARTISMALTISDFLNRPVNKYIAPTVSMAVPAEYKKWVPIVLGWITKSIAMSIAWYIQTIISAVTSAMSGGLIMSRAMMKIMVKNGWTLGLGLIKENDADTIVDEVASYIFAILGFYFQFRIGFKVPFPFNLILWPFEVAEYYIRWTITAAK